MGVCSWVSQRQSSVEEHLRDAAGEVREMEVEVGMVGKGGLNGKPLVGRAQKNEMTR